MKTCVVFCLAIAAFVVIFNVADAGHARCSCSGRCGNFNCNPATTSGCNCVSCTCIRGNLGFHRCCANCGGWFNKRKSCFRCPFTKAHCNCDGCY